MKVEEAELRLIMLGMLIDAEVSKGGANDVGMWILSSAGLDNVLNVLLVIAAVAAVTTVSPEESAEVTEAESLPSSGIEVSNNDCSCSGSVSSGTAASLDPSMLDTVPVLSSAVPSPTVSINPSGLIENPSVSSTSLSLSLARRCSSIIAKHFLASVSMAACRSWR